MLKIGNEAKRFEFEVGGDAYSIPAMAALPYKHARELAKKTDATAEECLEFFEGILSEYAPGLIDREDFTMGAMNDLVTAWMGSTGSASAGE